MGYRKWFVCQRVFVITSVGEKLVTCNKITHFNYKIKVTCNKLHYFDKYVVYNIYFWKYSGVQFQLHLNIFCINYGCMFSNIALYMFQLHSLQTQRFVTSIHKK